MVQRVSAIAERRKLERGEIVRMAAKWRRGKLIRNRFRDGEKTAFWVVGLESWVLGERRFDSLRRSTLPITPFIRPKTPSHSGPVRQC